jgi:hypothetical protein
MGSGNEENRSKTMKATDLENDGLIEDVIDSRASQGNHTSKVQGRIATSDQFSDGDESMSDDDGPEVEGAVMARERVELQVASERAAHEHRIAERKARARARDIAAIARKRAQHDRRVAERASPIPEEVLNQAAKDAELSVARERAQVEADCLRKQSGTLAVPTLIRVVEGREIVDLSRPEAGVAKQADSGRDAHKFLRKCMYGPNTKRVKAAVALRKTATARQVRGKVQKLSKKRTFFKR